MTALARCRLSQGVHTPTPLLARQSILGVPDRGSFAAEPHHKSREGKAREQAASPLFLLSAQKIAGKFKRCLPNLLGVLADGAIGGEPRLRAMLSMLARVQSEVDSHSLSTLLCVAQ